MAKARKFTSLKAAQDWLAAHGFTKTATQHVWQDGSRMAAVNVELGGVMPRFLIAMGDSKSDVRRHGMAIVAAHREAGVAPIGAEG